ncbi:MAG: 30S ribosomal protein S17 [Puniceicoccales bacterium]|jgi:small subunit ribosomal protein S17|nr:30S ribosomal protein S17 [Puniceicoccales bacterium]
MSTETTTAAAPAAAAPRNKRKDLTGKVTARSGDKSIKVTYEYKIAHPQYGKEVKRKTVVHVHDEKNECGVGDTVEIVSTRPLSKLKRWRVARIIEKAKIVGAAAAAVA